MKKILVATTVILVLALAAAIGYGFVITKDKEALITELESVQSVLTSTQSELNSTQAELTSTNQTLTLTQAELGLTKNILNSTQAELTSTKDMLSTTQGELTSTQEELDTTADMLSTTQAELDKRIPIPGDFSSVSELERWVSKNVQPRTSGLKQDFRSALRVQQAGLADGYLISVMYDAKDASMFTGLILNGALVNGALYVWHPENDAVWDWYALFLVR